MPEVVMHGLEPRRLLSSETLNYEPSPFPLNGTDVPLTISVAESRTAGGEVSRTDELYLRRFSVTNPTNLAVSLSAFERASDPIATTALKIITDTDGDGTLDDSERTGSLLLNLENDGGGTTVSLTVPLYLEPGAYFVLVGPNQYTFASQLDPGGSRSAITDVSVRLTATNAPPEALGVLFGSTPVLSGDTTPSTEEGTDFGSAIVNTAGSTREYQLTNTGGSTMTIFGVSASQGFQVLTNFGGSFTLRPGFSTNLIIGFTPQAEGANEGTITITTSPDISEYTFSVKGIATPTPQPQLAVTINGATVSPTGGTLNFGSLTVGSTSPTRTFTITNSGAGILSLSGFSAPAGVSPTGGSSILQPGESTEFTLTLQTGAPLLVNGNFQITTNDPSAPQISIAIKGVVGTPVVPPTVALPGLTLTLPSNGLFNNAKNTIRLSASIRNDTGIAISKKTKLPLSLTVSGPNGFSLTLKTIQVSLALNVDETRSISAVIPLPKSIPAGTYTVTATIAPAGGTSASAQTTFELLQPIASLANPTIELPAQTFAAGRKYTYNVTLTNSGNFAMKGSLKGNILLKQAGDGASTETVQIGKITVSPKLNAGASGTYKVTISIPKKVTLTPGIEGYLFEASLSPTGALAALFSGAVLTLQGRLTV